MKKLLILFLLLLVSSSTPALAANSISEDPKGFRGYPWNTSFDQINDQEELMLASSKQLNGKLFEIYYGRSYSSAEREQGLITLFAFYGKKLVHGSYNIPLKRKNAFLEQIKAELGPPSTLHGDKITWNFPTTYITGDVSEKTFRLSYFDQHFVNTLSSK